METKSGQDACNLSETAWRYLLDLNGAEPDSETARLVWKHALAIGYSPAYLRANEDGMRQDWPRVPMPAGLSIMASSAKLGEKIAELLDTESAVNGVTTGSIRTELRLIANISSITGRPLNIPDDLRLEAGWGHSGKEGITMPGSGKVVERDYSDEERESIQIGAESAGLSLEEALAQLGEKTFDVFLNDRACWKNIPQGAWNYTIGGYQVIKKWLSYREAKLVGRSISPTEARYVTQMTRRIAAVCLLAPQLDANYVAVKSNAYAWPK